MDARLLLSPSMEGEWDADWAEAWDTPEDVKPPPQPKTKPPPQRRSLPPKRRSPQRPDKEPLPAEPPPSDPPPQADTPQSLQVPEYDHKASDNILGIPLYPVTTPSGATVELQTKEEAAWYRRRQQMYLEHNKLTNVSDLQDLDRILMMETLVHRWTTWMSRGFDYAGMLVEDSQLKGSVESYSKELRQLKSSLGIDKSTRDKEKGAESIPDYLVNLRRRAMELGYHRNAQYEKAVTLAMELRSMVLTHDRCDAEERQLLDLSHETILQWIRGTFIPEFDEIDKSFRKNQKMWIKEL